MAIKLPDSLINGSRAQTEQSLVENFNKADFLWLGNRSNKKLMVYERASGI